MHDILINWAPHETRIAIVEDGALQELHLEQAKNRGLVGNIYLGKVVRVLPGMQSAFVDIGLERSAFLHVTDVSAGSKPAVSAQIVGPVPIEERVFEGQSLLVQVVKEPIGSKGARLSAQISLAGRMLVFLPQQQCLGVSQKIATGQAKALRLRLRSLLGQSDGGFILRTNAEHASDQELACDIDYLRRTWASICAAAKQLPATSMLHQDLNVMQRMLRDMTDAQTRSIQIDCGQQFAALRTFGLAFMPALTHKLQHYQGQPALFERHGINEAIALALEKRVPLQSGGYLVIDQTEALTVIDVNTGFFVGRRNFEDTVFKTNLEAATAIAHQLRLRNLGGIIVVDFIDMQDSAHRQEVWLKMRQQLARDRVKTTCGEFSKLGLLEMTRQRSRESLAQMLCRPCPHCAGAGLIKTAHSVVYAIFRQLLTQAHQPGWTSLRVLAAPATIELLGAQSEQLDALSKLIDKQLVLQSEPGMDQEQYDIVSV